MNAAPSSAAPFRGGGTIADQIAIRELIERYADACCTRDADMLASLWAEDGRWGVEGMPDLDGVDRDAVMAGWKRGMGQLSFAFVSFMPGRIDIDATGTSAEGRTYSYEIITSPNGTGRTAVGLYRDRFARIGGRWLFTERLWSMLHAQGDYIHAGETA
ncbi:nuclear transport factor 2 family protein [Rhizorhabdus dicambivorans]|uniref:Nuclear transport factor 2 family protein n=1 Tax=Rhizorhabdus dicambivorans TaxID=1850238 RepID=A0A2A4G050_9SPHN|nr:nuclear transport factor 2 family protein [Rhizorhabdus dicambivorans]ATE63190.1 nuclear transport factor 2 family protein [Rhizorhabdus dicambivorans]PCE43367.1 nuclear transport factor 2 family protein [Rhizorhabdus dicambivorans]